MDRELLDQVQAVLAEAGFGPDSGLTARAHDGDGVVVSWHADHLIRPTITAHAADPDIRTSVLIPGIRAALHIAVTTVITSAGLTTTDHPDGYLLVTPPPPCQGEDDHQREAARSAAARRTPPKNV
ncbi:hypothetical protein ACIRTB_23035 [Streptomyces sp. NPDC101158]|uniref:hypothetical protein n=1 Tax=Streptomyces sp. NPDC101158 TaxID=3366117 RepID=UPI0037F83C0B